MTKYVRLSDALFLVEENANTLKDASFKVSAKENVNHIWIYDRSGSMYGLLPELVKDLKAQARQLKEGDTISLGWFSGQGNYRFILKGFSVNPKNLKVLDQMLDEASSSLGTTCFSEILTDTVDIIRELKPLGPTFSLCFFTDGYPVVSNYEFELRSIRNAIGELGGLLSSALLVGYGQYYNKELMSEMSTCMGGFLIHSSDLPAFNEVFTQFVVDAYDSAPKQCHDLKHVPKHEMAFMLKGKSVNVMQAAHNDGVYVEFSPSKKGNNYIYYFTDEKPTGKEVKLSFKDGDKATGMVRAIYAGAYILTQRTKTDEALEMLGAIGDVALIKGITNAFTHEEYGRVEADLRKAVYVPGFRFMEGQNTKFVPPADAFSILDLFDVLVSDPEAAFYPDHESFEYNRIGRKTSAKEGYAKFVAKPGASSPLSDLTWNDSKLNLSVRAEIPGHAVLPQKEAAEFGFATKYPCKIFRNYTIVKDGALNVHRLPVSMSTRSLMALDPHVKVVRSDTQPDANGKMVVIHTLDLTSLPMVNRATARSCTSAERLARWKVSEVLYEAHQKVLKAAIEDLKAAGARGTIGAQPFTEEQRAFLESQGIKNGIFSPPSVREEAEDFYIAKEFKLDVAGFSRLPKVDEVKAKIAAKKKLNLCEAAMMEGIQLAAGATHLNKDVHLASLHSLLKKTQDNLRDLRSKIQRTKFAVILGHTWFSEFDSREDNEVVIDNTYTVKFSRREVQVPI
jgi:hypothetical protein